ncbi:hypothetical protein Moror_11034 [Moniliophthora roreri MCA 2997]|uniref:Uncharacterized protein n=2 Tax=Moniliophthora roreri TaxID=221103 RepID=V2Y0L5_MONRO|nr:hypothetical protein Moror_11034 [Moniliophthora roreri MCA 2997]KAI3619664.1 hypothetical protein WG66_002847 [Moniliophthora roreri]
MSDSASSRPPQSGWQIAIASEFEFLLSFLTTITIDNGPTFVSFVHPTQSFHSPLMHNNICPHCNQSYNGPSALTNYVQRCAAGCQSMQGLFNMAKCHKVVHNQPIAGSSTQAAVPTLPPPLPPAPAPAPEVNMQLPSDSV